METCVFGSLHMKNGADAEALSCQFTHSQPLKSTCNNKFFNDFLAFFLSPVATRQSFPSNNVFLVKLPLESAFSASRRSVSPYADRAERKTSAIVENKLCFNFMCFGYEMDCGI